MCFTSSPKCIEHGMVEPFYALCNNKQRLQRHHGKIDNLAIPDTARHPELPAVSAERTPRRRRPCGPAGRRGGEPHRPRAEGRAGSRQARCTESAFAFVPGGRDRFQEGWACSRQARCSLRAPGGRASAMLTPGRLHRKRLCLCSQAVSLPDADNTFLCERNVTNSCPTQLLVSLPDAD